MTIIWLIKHIVLLTKYQHQKPKVCRYLNLQEEILIHKLLEFYNCYIYIYIYIYTYIHIYIYIYIFDVNSKKIFTKFSLENTDFFFKLRHICPNIQTLAHSYYLQIWRLKDIKSHYVEGTKRWRRAHKLHTFIDHSIRYPLRRQMPLLHRKISLIGHPVARTKRHLASAWSWRGGNQHCHH